MSNVIQFPDRRVPTAPAPKHPVALRAVATVLLLGGLKFGYDVASHGFQSMAEDRSARSHAQQASALAEVAYSAGLPSEGAQEHIQLGYDALQSAEDHRAQMPEDAAVVLGLIGASALLYRAAGKR